MGMAREDEYIPCDEDEMTASEAADLVIAASRELSRARDLHAKAIKRERSHMPDPGWEHFTFEVRYRNNARITYRYAARRMKNGAIYTTATERGATFPSWEGLVRWLRDSEKIFVSPLRELTETDRIAVVR